VLAPSARNFLPISGSLGFLYDLPMGVVAFKQDEVLQPGTNVRLFGSSSSTSGANPSLRSSARQNVLECDLAAIEIPGHEAQHVG